MCGFSGFWDLAGGPEPELAALARAMADTLAHRGPDDAGVFVDPAAGYATGHRRLTILDLSPAGHQPMATPDGRFVLSYNGEVYNHAELRRDLEAQGVRFRGTSDTETVLHALARWGVEPALERFVGMFAFALWDGLERTLVLARDRLGIKPLYYGTQGGTHDGVFLFGSELKALHRHPRFRRTIDKGALALYFRFAYVPAPHSIWEGIAKLPPGSWALVKSPTEVSVRTYWSARAVAEAGLRDPLALDEGEAVEELDRLLRDAVKLRMLADVPLGAFLSGGIDSSTVVALMQAQSERPVKTFTIGFREEGFDEAEHARRVAAALGTDHSELTVTPDEARASIPTLAEAWDEPFADSSQIPTRIVSRFAREHVTVCLSGDGGDELFGGYPRYFHALRLRRYLRLLPRPSRRAMAAAINAVSPSAWEGFSRRSPRWARMGLDPGWAGYRANRLAELLATLGKGSLYRSLVSHWKEPARLVRGAVEPATVFDEAGAWPAPRGFLEQMMCLDSLTYLPDDILCKVDRASMAEGLEARVPLLDHRVFAFAWRLPSALRVGPPPGKRLLRALLARYVPRELFERPKMGFGIPIADWLRGPLRPWAEELLAPERLTRGELFDPLPIRRRFEEHVSGRMNWGYYLWDVLVFQSWRERWQA